MSENERLLVSKSKNKKRNKGKEKEKTKTTPLEIQRASIRMQARSVLRAGAGACLRTLAAPRTASTPAVSAAVRSRAFHVTRPAFAKGRISIVVLFLGERISCYRTPSSPTLYGLFVVIIQHMRDLAKATV